MPCRPFRFDFWFALAALVLPPLTEPYPKAALGQTQRIRNSVMGSDRPSILKSTCVMDGGASTNFECARTPVYAYWVIGNDRHYTSS